jgi:hypothetical protein
MGGAAVSAAGWLTFLGIIITAVLGLIGAWVSTRASKSSAQRNAEVEQMKMQLSARDNQVQSWRTDAEALRAQRDAAQQRIDQLRRAAADRERVVNRLRRRLQGMIAWARRVIDDSDALAANLPGPPMDLGDTDPNGWDPAGGGRR